MSKARRSEALGLRSTSTRTLDYLAWSTLQLSTVTQGLLRMGFDIIGHYEDKPNGLMAHLFNQNDIRFWVSQWLPAVGKKGRGIANFASNHGTAISALALRVTQIYRATLQACGEGWKVTNVPKSFFHAKGRLERSTLQAKEDLRLVFLRRDGDLWFPEIPSISIPHSSHDAGILSLSFLVYLSAVDPQRDKTGFDTHQNLWSAAWNAKSTLAHSRTWKCITSYPHLGYASKKPPASSLPQPLTNRPFYFIYPAAETPPHLDESILSDFLDMHHGPGIAIVGFYVSSIPQALAHCLLSPTQVSRIETISLASHALSPPSKGSPSSDGKLCLVRFPWTSVLFGFLEAPPTTSVFFQDTLTDALGILCQRSAWKSKLQ